MRSAPQGEVARRGDQVRQRLDHSTGPSQQCASIPILHRWDTQWDITRDIYWLIIMDASGTHAFIAFSLDLSMATTGLWVILGEAKSKAEHIARALLPPETSRELLAVYLSKGALATTAIEGNTLTEAEARGIVDGTLTLPKSRDYLQREIENVIALLNEVKEDVLADPTRDLTPDDIRRINRRVLDGLRVEPGVVPGDIRTYSVTVGPRYRAPDATECSRLLDRLCDWMNSDDFTAPPEAPELAAPLAILQAIVMHFYMAWIHPFGDGNGRTARALELWLLLRAGFPQPATHLLSNHYNATRTEYYAQLDAAGRSRDPSAFLLYAARGFVDGLREQLGRIWDDQCADRWEQYVYETVGTDERTESGRRRIKLALAIARAPEPVAKADVSQLTSALAGLFATKTGKTLTRDLNDLVARGLLVRQPNGYVANVAVLRGLLPARTDGVLDLT